MDVCHDVRRKSGDEFNILQKWVSDDDKGTILVMNHERELLTIRSARQVVSCFCIHR